MLHVSNLVKRYGAVKAVDNVTFSVEEGEVFGFLGPNGSGKTTTISLILSLLRPDSGQIEILGKRVSFSDPSALRAVGALVGSHGFVPYLSGRQNLTFVAGYLDLTSRRLDEVLDIMGLTQAANRPVSGYSLGMKQRLGLARALMHSPRLLILDEPTNGLDPSGIRDIRNILKELPAQGITVFLSSHNLHEVEQVCGRVAVLSQGKIAYCGSVSQLSKSSTNTLIRVANAGLCREALAQWDVQTDGDYLVVHYDDADEVMTKLISLGIVPLEVKRQNNNLEAMYLELTKESL